MKKLGFIITALLFSGISWAQSSREEISNNVCLSGSNYLAYPAPEKALTPAPKGKKAFYISHYGRHGSRYLCDDNEYNTPRDVFEKAEKLGKLTEKGREVLKKMQLMREESRKRAGELSELGAQQHREIAHRMYERFPDVFKDNVWVDAKSTVVIRCILSMENELLELASLNPKLQMKHDASEHDMYYMNHWDKNTTDKKWTDEMKVYQKRWTKENIHPERVMAELFNDPDYVEYNIDAMAVYRGLFNLAGIVQDTEIRHQLSLYDVFNEEEIYKLWQMQNIGWFLEFGPCSMNGATQPYTQRKLLKQMINEADSCMQYEKPGATLRFGHETMVLPLTCLLNLNGYGETMHPDDLEKNHWYNYKIFPMGCNIQFIFYRSSSKDKDVWVKVLLNEEEATMPLQPVEGPYYRWEDVRKYYLDKINAYEN